MLRVAMPVENNLSPTIYERWGMDTLAKGEVMKDFKYEKGGYQKMGSHKKVYIYCYYF